MRVLAINVVGTLALSLAVSMIRAEAEKSPDLHPCALTLQSRDLPSSYLRDLPRSIDQRACSPVDLKSAISAGVRDLGYFNAVIEEPQWHPQKTGDLARPEVTVAIVAGVRYRWGRVRVIGARALTRNHVRRVAALHGNPFSPTAVRGSLDKIRSLYATRGYLEATPTPVFVVNGRRHTIDVAIFVQEGDLKSVRTPAG